MMMTTDGDDHARKMTTMTARRICDEEDYCHDAD
jgi:hypothetical protein